MSYRDFLAAVEGRDLFVSHDAAAGHDLDIDPYAAFGRLRAEAEVVPADLHDVLGISADIMVTAQSGGYRDLTSPVFSAVSFDSVRIILKDAESFNQEITRRAYTGTFGRALNTLDPPDHSRMRAIVDQVFGRRSMASWCSDIVAPLARRTVRRALADAASDGEIELVGQLLFTYPAEVITTLLGLPEDRIGDFMRCAVAMGSFFDADLAHAGAQAITDWVREIVTDRRAAGGAEHDLIGLLINAEVDGARLEDEEILSFVRLLYPAGYETTFRALSNTLVGLLTTGQWELVARDRSLAPVAVEEGLRWEPSVLGHPRWASRDTTVCGVDIPAGSVVHAFHASANRDESRWEHAERYDLRRPRLGNSTFGFGPHTCLGMHLARFEMTAMLAALADAIPRLRLSPRATPDEYRVRGLALRSPRSIPVVVA
ncbi:cytochrome P450 [Jatrophihabitans cynanchi]|uniref:Cytochrome P450 n=1 Tax=Jatrophihabitans cynanchi TaxID=2944128 RepID=A0ABY7K1K6_9ACTN|nr:cytochrome P450 [Jatrophihabitans sp. SB3-54]WAX58398.1 cytochrome P450 [Jatrophihabitans sp. SB3-54]